MQNKDGKVRQMMMMRRRRKRRRIIKMTLNWIKKTTKRQRNEIKRGIERKENEGKGRKRRREKENEREVAKETRGGQERRLLRILTTTFIPAVYINVQSMSGPVQVMVDRSAGSRVQRRWNIKVAQIPCSSQFRGG